MPSSNDSTPGAVPGNNSSFTPGSLPRGISSMDDLPPTPPLLAVQRQPSVDVTVLADHLPAGYTAAFDPSPNLLAQTGRHSPRLLPQQHQQQSDTALPLTRPPLSVGGTWSSSSHTNNNNNNNNNNNDDSDAAAAEGAFPEDSSLKLQGGDMHRDLFKLDRTARMGHRRAHTFHYPADPATLIAAGPSGSGSNSGHEGDGFYGAVGGDGDPTLSVPEQLMPGGFRRQYVIQRQQALQRRRRSVAARMPVTRNFIEFLELYGSFAGEDLNDSDDEDAIIDDEDEEIARAAEAEAADSATSNERRPLLGHKPSTRSLAPRAANATLSGTFFTLLKAFIGTGIMFLPKAFYNGGILVSSLTMIFISCVTMLAFHLLLECKRRVVADGHGGGYGDIGAAVLGRRMRTIILGSVTLSQLGFVCTGLVFVAENLAVFLRAVMPEHNSAPLSIASLVLLQLIVLIPLSFIRQISKLGFAAIIADVFILLGVGYMYWYCTGTLATLGINETVVAFNPAKYTLMIGAVIFTFEGIGLILPIEASMAQPEKFERLLGIVMLLITILFTSVGALCYATFGSETETEILSNFPQDSRLVNCVQFLYSLAVLFGNPVQFFPALRILEAKAFGIHRSGRRSWRTKWKKNAFRTALLFVCAGVAIAGSASLDRFVSLIGSVACVPLVYVYPALLHLKAVAKTPRAKMVDVALITMGSVGMIFTTTITVWTSFMS
jgi:proton-coupled amino acid transporter